MKNNMSYEEAVEYLKKLEETQRNLKDYNKYLVQDIAKKMPRKLVDNMIANNQSRLERNIKLINLTLSVIHAHKAARKMYQEVLLYRTLSE